MVIFMVLTLLQSNWGDTSIQIKDDERVWKVDPSGA